MSDLTSEGMSKFPKKEDPKEANIEPRLVGNLLSPTSLLARCRGAFFSALLLVEENSPCYILTDWVNGDWSIFLGPEDLAKEILLGRPQALAKAIKWKSFPARDGWLCEPYSPRQIAKWIIDQKADQAVDEKPYPEYRSWLKDFVAKLAIESDTLPTIIYSDGVLSAWLHHRNPDLTPKGMPISLYSKPIPLPRGFEEDRRVAAMSGPDNLNGGWPFSRGSGWTVRSTGISDEWKDPN